LMMRCLFVLGAFSSCCWNGRSENRLAHACTGGQLCIVDLGPGNRACRCQDELDKLGSYQIDYSAYSLKLVTRIGS
jgi:hypothetical protein